MADGNLIWISLTENNRIPIQISLKFVPKTRIDNTPALVQVIAYRDKPMPKLMLTHFADVYVRH